MRAEGGIGFSSFRLHPSSFPYEQVADPKAIFWSIERLRELAERFELDRLRDAFQDRNGRATEELGIEGEIGGVQAHGLHPRANIPHETGGLRKKD
jgi:hypothetical protein